LFYFVQLEWVLSLPFPPFDPRSSWLAGVIAGCVSGQDRVAGSARAVIDSRAGRGQRTTIHPGTQVIEDLEGHLREWFTRHATRFAVIRPDRYVAAHADEISLGAAVNRLRGMLEPGAGHEAHAPNG